MKEEERSVENEISRNVMKCRIKQDFAHDGRLGIFDVMAELSK